jgi:hypothetical protein
MTEHECDTPTVSHEAIAVLNVYHIAKLRHSGCIANDNATHVECDNTAGDTTRVYMRYTSSIARVLGRTKVEPGQVIAVPNWALRMPEWALTAPRRALLFRLY